VRRLHIQSKKTVSQLYTIPNSNGGDIAVPAAEGDDDRYFTLDQPDGIRKYYDEYGYVVLRRLLPQTLCDRAARSYETEIKPFTGFFYRQASGNPERHVFSKEGFMLNPILNVQSLDRRRFAEFRQAGLDLLTHPNMQSAVSLILGEPGKPVQSMYILTATR
jgi:phytanoyl-CoA hydroxylase